MNELITSTPPTCPSYAKLVSMGNLFNCDDGNGTVFPASYETSTNHQSETGIPEPTHQIIEPTKLIGDDFIADMNGGLNYGIDLSTHIAEKGIETSQSDFGEVVVDSLKGDIPTSELGSSVLSSIVIGAGAFCLLKMLVSRGK